MNRPNIVWVTLDSVRQDHTSLAGYERDTTPRIQRIADEPDGQAYRNCIGHSKSTLPASGAILTCTPPSHNTVGITGETVPDSIPTVAELFSDAGYHTACLSRNSFVSSATDLDRGFDQFEWLAASTIHRAGPRTLLKYFLNLRRHSAGLTTNTAKHATPFLMNEVAKRWLSSAEDRADPSFFYLHYNEPHRPYYPPLPYLDRYTDDLDVSPAEAGERTMNLHYSQKERIAYGDFTDDDLSILEAMYDAEIAYTDEMIGRLYEFVRSLDMGETIFVVTADHGELFGELGLLGHNLALHDGLVNVPLVTHGLDTDAESDDLLQHIDVMRTLLEIADADTGSTDGIDLRSGARDHAFSQREAGQFEPYLEHNADFDTERYHEPMLTAARTLEFKRLTSEQKSELFELPDEETDAADDFHEVDAELADVTAEWLDTTAKPVTEGVQGEFTDAMERQLEDLGYV